MNYYELEASFTYVPVAGEAPPVDQFIDEVHDHLVQLGAEDVHIVLDEATHEMTFSVLVSANPGESVEASIGKGMGLLRTAFHYCGAATPGWPMPQDLIFGGVNFQSVQVDTPNLDLTAV